MNVTINAMFGLIGTAVVMLGVYHGSYLVALVGCGICSLIVSH